MTGLLCACALWLVSAAAAPAEKKPSLPDRTVGVETKTILATGKLDDATKEALAAACEKAVDRFLKEHPEASVG